MKKEEITKELWRKFKSPLGNSSIDNKFNSMYDLENFVLNIYDQGYQDGISDTTLNKIN